MARRRRTRRGQPAVEKAAATSLPGGLALPAGSSVADATAMLGALQARTAGAVNGAVPLPREHGFYSLFGPGAPLFPAPLNTPNPASGQADPRRYQYPVSWNLTNQHKLIDWQILRDGADKVDIIRLCLETRKNELAEQEWDIAPSKRAAQRAGARTRADRTAMRDTYADVITRLMDWWETPDRANDQKQQQWLLALLEEHLVLDAATLFPRLTRGGDLHSLTVIDGSTIKPLLDEYGNMPMPPLPAYQQWLYGFPRGEYTAGGDAPWQATKGGDLVYEPRNVRAWTPYGFSVVEQALVSAEMYLNRQGWMRSEYSDGTLPTSWLKTDSQVGALTPEQYRAWEAAINDYLAGDTAARHRHKLLPAGFDPVPTADVSERYRPEYDEFLLKLLCAHIGVPPEEIGFTQSRGLGSAGHAESQDSINKRKSIRSVNRWLVDILNGVSQKYLGMPRELTFKFLSDDEDDDESADEVADTRVKGGRNTVNEDRDERGQPRYDGEWADKPFIVAAGGPIWLEKAYEDATAPPPEPMMAPLPGEPQPAGGGGGGGSRSAGAPGLPSVQPRTVGQGAADRFSTGDRRGAAGTPRDGDGDGIIDEKADGELGAFVRYVRKRRTGAARPFQFGAVDGQLAGVLNELAATDPAAAVERAQLEKAAAADAGGRDRRGAQAPQPRQADGQLVGAHRYGAGFDYP